MKKYYSVLAILAISLVACNKESNSQVSSIHEALVENGLKYIEIAVSQEKPVDPETKATLSDVSMAFGPGDQIAILATKDATTAPVTLAYLRYEDSKVFFGGSVDEEATISPYAYYPASIATSTERVINWPTTIDGSKVQVPMIAYLNKEAGSARFQHLGAIAKITVANCPAGASKLKFTANTNITGGYTVSDFKTGTPTVSASGELTGTTITATIDGNGTYYIPLPVNSSSGTSYANFQFALINSADTYYYKQKTATDSFGPFARKNIVNFGTLTYDIDQIDEWYLVSAVNSWHPNNRDLRYIKIAGNQYRIATWSNAGGYKVVEGHETTSSDDWTHSYGGSNAEHWSDPLVEQSSTNCGYNRDNNIMTSTIITTPTLSYSGTDNSWGDTYYCYGKIALKWEDTEYQMSTASTHCHNWVLANLTVSSNSEYRFSISHWKDDGTRDKYRTNSSLHITDSTPYGKLSEVESVGDNSCHAVLTQGTYTVYYNDAQGDIMFVKAAPSL